MDHFLTTFTNNVNVGIRQYTMYKQQSHEQSGKMEIF